MTKDSEEGIDNLLTQMEQEADDEAEERRLRRETENQTTEATTLDPLPTILQKDIDSLGLLDEQEPEKPELKLGILRDGVPDLGYLVEDGLKIEKPPLTTQPIHNPVSTESQYKNNIANYPSNPECHYDYGLFLFEARRYTEAQNEFKKAIKLKPDSADYHYYLGMTYIRQGKIWRGTRQLKKVIIYDTNHSSAIKELNRICDERNRKIMEKHRS